MTPEEIARFGTFLEEAARYFENRPTHGEDAAHWSNVTNAETCRKIAAALTAERARAEKAEASAERMWCIACGTVSRDDTCDCTKTATAHLRRAVNYADAQRARAEKAEADVAFLRRRRGELVIQRDEERAKRRATLAAWREAEAELETERKARDAAREAALREAADACQRRTALPGSVFYAVEAAACANAILALIPKEPEKGPCPACGCEETDHRNLWTCRCPAPEEPDHG